MNIFHGIILGIVQGLTEFIPVSSSGHLILVRQFLGIVGTNDLAVDAVLQLATILAVVVYFRKDILDMCVTFFRIVSRKEVEVQKSSLVYAVIVGTIPALVLGLLLEKKMDTLFRDVHLVAYALIAGSVLMFFAEKSARQLSALTPKKGFVIGLFQSLALVPGVSRSGATISGGLFQGLTRSEATRFSFLLSFPIIMGSGLKKLFELITVGEFMSAPLGVSFLCAFIVGLIAIHYLLKYLNRHSLSVFIWYRIVLAILILALI